jgi:hypothetical protein
MLNYQRVAEQNPDLSVPRVVGRIAAFFWLHGYYKKSKQTCFDDNGKKVRGPLQESTCWHARSRTLAPLQWLYRRQCTYLCFNPEVTPMMDSKSLSNLMVVRHIN